MVGGVPLNPVGIYTFKLTVGFHSGGFHAVYQIDAVRLIYVSAGAVTNSEIILLYAPENAYALIGAKGQSAIVIFQQNDTLSRRLTRGIRHSL